MTAENAVVIPDSVEPYIGYKWLGYTGNGTLYSHHGGAQWRENEPFEAECMCDWGWYWTIAPTGQENRVSKGWSQYHSNGQLQRERCWNITENTGLTTTDQKPPKKPKVILPAGWAYSYARRPCPHDPVAEECSCGIYAASDIKHTSNYERHNSVLVKVAIWGRTIIGTDGARGQYAYPQAFIDTTIKDKKVLEGLGRRYGVPFPGSDKTTPNAEPSMANPSTAKLAHDTAYTVTATKPEKKKKTGVWHSPGLFNPGRFDTFTLTIAALMGALTLGMVACGLFCFYAAGKDLLALPFGIAILLVAGLLGSITGDMFCEGCGRKGWM